MSGSRLITVTLLVVCLVTAPLMAIVLLWTPGTQKACQQGAEPTSIPSARPPQKDGRWDGEQLANASAILNTTNAMHLPPQASVDALAAAMQESGLRNLNGGDRDSLGLFQQRPSQGWGSPQQIQDPSYATRQFLQHLVQLPNWQSLPAGQAVQQVQRSADASGEAYQRWSDDARQLASDTQGAQTTPVAQLEGCRPSPGQPSPSQGAALTAAVQGSPGTIKVLGSAVTPLFSSVPSSGYPNSFPAGQCTYYAAWQHRVTWSGNAGDWYANAQAQGAHVTNSPTVGAIAVWRAGPRYSIYGHVGIVIAVAPTSYTVAEMNYRGVGVVDQRVVGWPDSDVEGFIP